jgi:hypothetical protein
MPEEANNGRKNVWNDGLFRKEWPVPFLDPPLLLMGQILYIH